MMQRAGSRVVASSLRSLARRPAVATRALSATAAAKDDTKTFVIPGYRSEGRVAQQWELATGAERYEYLKRLKGEEPWEDMTPIYLTKLGTPKEPVIVTGTDVERYVGCSGFPADSHETVWLTLRSHRGVDRCPHCGNVFKYIRQEEHHDEHHH